MPRLYDMADHDGGVTPYARCRVYEPTFESFEIDDPDFRPKTESLEIAIGDVYEEKPRALVSIGFSAGMLNVSLRPRVGPIQEMSIPMPADAAAPLPLA